MKTWSTRLPATSRSGRTVSTVCGQETIGSSAAASTSTTRSYAASGPGCTSRYSPGGTPRSARYSRVVASGGTYAFLAPSSIARLHSVMRSETLRPRTWPPWNSTDRYVAPSAVRSPISRSIRSFAVTPGANVPSISTRSEAGTRIQRLPVTHVAVTSLKPTPVPNAPSAP